MHNNSLYNQPKIIKPVKKINTLEQDVRDGLGSKPFQLHPKYFYDEFGSQLFDQICNLDDYYPTRTEQKLIEKHADEIIKRTCPDHIVEFGSGTSRKTRILLDSCHRLGVRCVYWPMDICVEVLEDTQRALQDEYPWLEVHPLVGDYLAGINDIKLPNGRKLCLFLGSTIGNLTHETATEFMCQINVLLEADDRFLMGIDHIKDKDIMETAYDDSQGVTAAFNLNMLSILNRELDANFALNNFTHQAVYYENKECVEMHLVAKSDQSIHIKALDMDVEIEEGEFICTSSSRKFTQISLDNLIKASHYEEERNFFLEEKPFSLLLMRPADYATASYLSGL